MPGIFAQALPFTSAAAALVGRTFKIPALSAGGKVGGGQSLFLLLIDLFTIATICALAAEGGIDGGVVKGALIGTAAAGLAYVAPIAYMDRTLAKYCGTCTTWGRLGLGISMLIGLFVLLLLVNWLMFSRR